LAYAMVNDESLRVRVSFAIVEVIDAVVRAGCRET
jgi:hypothetical protein